jgi:hypothetical protein
MSTLRTADSLLASGSWLHFRHRLRIDVRSRRLRRAAGHPFVHRTRHFPFICVPGVPDSEETFLTGEFDSWELNVLCAWLEPGDAFVDVGANLGLSTFCAHHHLRGRGMFLAIEASPVTPPLSSPPW